MTGRRYYITTLADWRRHAHRFATSHWLALGDANANSALIPSAASAQPRRDPSAAPGECVAIDAGRELDDAPRAVREDGVNARADAGPPRNVDDAARIVVLVDADEGVHLALDDDAAFEALPHPFAPKAISHAAHEALAAHGVAPGSTTFDAAEAVARAHPLLRPRVF
jgi:hypothetical protein